MSFAENLKYVRKKHNITQEQLADILSVSRQAISKWECARSIIQAGINHVYLRIGEGAGNYIVMPAKDLEWNWRLFSVPSLEHYLTYKEDHIHHIHPWDLSS